MYNVQEAAASCEGLEENSRPLKGSVDIDVNFDIQEEPEDLNAVFDHVLVVDDGKDYPLYDHFALGHSLCEDDGINRIYKTCPGCSLDKFEDDLMNNPKALLKDFGCDLGSEHSDPPTSTRDHAPPPPKPSLPSICLTHPICSPPGHSHSASPPCHNPDPMWRSLPAIVVAHSRQKTPHRLSAHQEAKKEVRRLKHILEQELAKLAAHPNNHGDFTVSPPAAFSMHSEPTGETSSSKHKNLHHSPLKQEAAALQSAINLVKHGFSKILDEAKHIHADQEHNQFAKRPRSQAKVREFVKTLGKTLAPYPDNCNLFVSPNPNLPHLVGCPLYLIMCFASLIPASVCKVLWSTWLALKTAGIQMVKSNANRSTEPQLHTGIWGHYKQFSYVLRETLLQTPAGEKALDELMHIVGAEVVPRLKTLLAKHDPTVLERQRRAYEYIYTFKHIHKAIKEHPAIDMGGLFFTLAIKEGGSQIPHLDWLDHPGIYAFVLTVACFPQLGKKIKTYPGMVIAFQARYLAHFAGESTGQRLVITCFSDQFTVACALKMFGDVVIIN
ncbi:hypothetical protein M422DRAFT_25637 [Sphaerobolus stellatus SS14]|nr:hypothetical protein M422DRAFT_25637 [Sphaerobolus stellatus SS14]